MKTKGDWGGLLVAVGVLLALGAFMLWTVESSNVEDRQRTEGYAAAIGGRFEREISPNRSGSIALGAAGGVLFLSGIVLLASNASESEPG